MIEMVTILPPDLSITFLVALIVPLVLGLIVGVVLKAALTIGLVIAAIVIILIALGFLTPDQVLQPVVAMFKSGSTLNTEVNRIAGYLPYSSITFILGVIIGFLASDEA